MRITAKFKIKRCTIYCNINIYKQQFFYLHFNTVNIHSSINIKLAFHFNLTNIVSQENRIIDSQDVN